jgi:hypothetical protein
VSGAVVRGHLEQVGALDAAEVVVRVVEVALQLPVDQVRGGVERCVPRASDHAHPLAAGRVPMDLRVPEPLGVLDLGGRRRGASVGVDDHRVGSRGEGVAAVGRPVEVLLLVLADAVGGLRREGDDGAGAVASRVRRVDDGRPGPDREVGLKRHHGAVVGEGDTVGRRRVVPAARAVVLRRVQVVELVGATRGDRPLRVAEPSRGRRHVVDRPKRCRRGLRGHRHGVHREERERTCAGALQQTAS